jgi:macrolide transport system ATP-binding/permease protein
MSALFRKLGWLIKRRGKEDQLDAELRFHLSETADELRQDGLPEEEARWAARRELGNVSRLKEETRAAWSWTLLEQLAQDLRFAARTAKHNPAFMILASLSLALGIGANTAIYSFMDALLMRPLPVPEAESLVALNWHVMGNKSIHDSVVHTESGFFYDDPKTGKTTPIFVRPGDPRAIAAAVAILLIAGLLAGYLPARKASRIDPMTAVRHE